MVKRRFARLGGAVFLGLACAAGCHAGSADGVPKLEDHDELIFQGGSPLSYRAPAAGQVTVFDVNQDANVYSGPIGDGELFELDPPNQVARVNGRVAARDLRRGDVLRVTFQPSGL